MNIIALDGKNAIIKSKLYLDFKMKSIFTYIKKNQLKEIKILIKENSAVLQQRDIQQNTPLLLATKLNKKEIISYLLRQNTNINAQNNLGLTSLIYAAKNNELALIKKLISKGADINLESIHEIGALGYAVKYQHYLVFNYLIKLTAPNKKYTSQQEALVKACFTGNLSKLKKILTKNVNINFSYYFGFTLLMFAANSGNKDTVEYLIKNGANVNQKNNMNDTALRMATVSNYAVVKLLIKHGAQINILTKQGFSPLLSAIFLKKNSIVKLLLKEGANPNLSGKHIKTEIQEINQRVINILKNYGGK